jgi:energy-coupling factor transporter ATP-binding protein EcfA2
MEQADVIIIGAGPAGLSAGIYAGYYGLRAIIFEENIPGGLAAEIPLLEDYPGLQAGISGRSLVEKMVEQCKKPGAEIRQFEKVNNLILGMKEKIVETDKSKYTADYVIIASGRQPKALDVPGANEFRGKGVSYCAVCDSAFFKNRKVAVIGEGTPAAEVALYLAEFASSLILACLRPRAEAERILIERLKKRDVEVLVNVEKSISEPFIPNDTLLDFSENSLLMITGPNMAGKSTYIRQCAILVIMAQIGSFIPAKSASIGIVDKIFTRIGAHDEITKGQSTFMVEMSETAEILNNLSPRSLIILDEIGRGTSTFDGLSLAWAIAEFLAVKNARTLFATHFHELTELQKEYKGVKNYNVAVKEWEDEIIFLHKIIPGGTDDSYGIYVAKLAGIPKEVLTRSKQILAQLELYSNLDQKILKKCEGEKQLSLFSDTKAPIMEEIKKDLEKLHVDSLTPFEALQKIHKWKEKINHE